MACVLAEVVARVNHDAARIYHQRSCAFGFTDSPAQYVDHDVVISDPVRPGSRR
jgi:hypothetical protein